MVLPQRGNSYPAEWDSAQMQPSSESTVAQRVARIVAPIETRK